VGYAVRAADFNGDGRTDIAIVDAKRFLWLENPAWTVHTIHETPDAPFDNVCFAAHDIDRDGDLDLAMGCDWQPNNTLSGGAIGWLECPADPREKWLLHALTNDEPTTHRMNWADLDGNGRRELVVAPLKGRGATAPGWDNAPVRVSRWDIPAENPDDNWKNSTVEKSLPVMHNFHVVDFDRDGRDDLLLASFEGVHLWSLQGESLEKKLIQLGSGNPGKAPARGASEIRIGRLNEPQSYLATIEPWHGNEVVIYEQPADLSVAQVVLGQGKLWPRKVLDNELAWGHAVACVNLDQDLTDELVIGVRDDGGGNRCGVRIYDRAPNGDWTRKLLNPGEVAVEDLVAADLDGDSQAEIIAVGRATKNAVIYTRGPQ
jgi:hypothetical protein